MVGFQSYVVHCQAVDGELLACVSKNKEIKHLVPSFAVLRRVFQELFVEGTTAIELSHLQFQFDVLAEQLVFRTFTDRDALKVESLPRLFEILPKSCELLEGSVV